MSSGRVEQGDGVSRAVRLAGLPEQGDVVSGAVGLAGLAESLPELGALVDPERAVRMVGATRGLVAQAAGGALGRGPAGPAAGVVDALVGMVATLETSINALAAQRCALLAIAVAVVDAAPATMVPMAPDRAPSVTDRELARSALVSDVAAASGTSETTTATLVDTSCALVERLPGALTAMAAGALGDRHVARIVRHAEGLAPEAAGRYEADVLARLDGRRTPAEVGRVARAARERCHPRPLAKRHRRAMQDRAVHLDEAPDGMAWLHAFLPAVQAGAIFDKITGIARSLQTEPDERRTLAQLRADALTGLTLDPPTWALADGGDGAGGADPGRDTAAPADGEGDATGAPAAGEGHVGSAAATDQVHATGAHGADHGRPSRTPQTGQAHMPSAPAADQTDGPPGVAGSPAGCIDPALLALRPTVAVTVPALTLLGLSDEPGHLDGYGPVDPDTARVLAAHAPSFIRLLTHPERGTVLSVGRDRYAVPADLRTWLRLRDGTCRFPGCGRSTARAEVDHTVPFREGGANGETAAGNLAFLCRKHHRLKHTTRWQVVQHPDASMTWTSPTGRTHTTRPARTGQAEARGDPPTD